MIMSPDRRSIAVTRPGAVGVGLTSIDWMPVGDWQIVGWASPELVALRRRGELGLLDTGRRMLVATHPVVGRTVRCVWTPNGVEALVAVVRAGRPVLCRYFPEAGKYHVLDATEGVSSVAAWDPARGVAVINRDRQAVLVRYDDTSCAAIELGAESAASSDGPLVAVTGVSHGIETPGVFDLGDLSVSWYAAEGAGLAVSPSGLLLTVSWVDHRYLYRVLRDGEVVGESVPDHGIATDLDFSADERHLLGHHQSPAAPPVLASWEIGSGRMTALQPRAEIAVRWRHRDSAQSPEWLYEPENAHGGVVLHLHGGPRSQLRQIHEPVIAALVSHGWTVIGMNYPGSSGYSDEFRDVVVGDWGGADAAAVIARLRELRSSGPLCLYGQSYGAYLALLAASGLVDAVAVWAPVTDLPHLLESASGVQRQWLVGELGELASDPARLRERSPVDRVIEVPRLLVGHSKGDEKVPVEQSRRFVERVRNARYLEQVGDGHEPGDLDEWTAAVLEVFA